MSKVSLWDVIFVANWWIVLFQLELEGLKTRIDAREMVENKKM